MLVGWDEIYSQTEKFKRSLYNQLKTKLKKEWTKIIMTIIKERWKQPIIIKSIVNYCWGG